jgi:hypothetical protein
VANINGEKGETMFERILTPEQRQLHINRHFWRDDKTEFAAELLGDIATVNGNQFHNPETGFHEFYPDTPAWIREISKKRGW